MKQKFALNEIKLHSECRNNAHGQKYGNNSSNDVHPNWQRTSRNCNSCKRDLRDILIYQQKFRLNTGLCVTIFYTIAVIFVG